MFCRNCGAEMSETARFCSKCGYDRMGKSQQDKENVEDDIIKYQVKPKFNIPYKIITNMGRIIFYIYFIGCACFPYLPRLWRSYSTIIILGVLAVSLMYILIRTIIEKMQYEDLEYNFYNKKIEYKDGFLNKEQKELKYKHVREVIMNQNILESMFNIGTIRIYTNASSGGYGSSSHSDMRGRNGIFIHCVDNVQEQYKIIKEIIDEGTPEE